MRKFTCSVWFRYPLWWQNRKQSEPGISNRKSLVTLYYNSTQSNYYEMFRWDIPVAYFQWLIEVSTSVEQKAARFPRPRLLYSNYILHFSFICVILYLNIQGVPLATEPGISLIILPLMRILKRNLKRTTDIFLSISHTMNALLFKCRCNIFIGVIIINLLAPELFF